MPILILGGVTAVGKTTTAKKLKELLNWDYIEADDYHPESNIDKMRAGVPLTDEDRVPWLMGLHEEVKKRLLKNENCIITCSALKKSYRRILLTGSPNIDNVANINGKCCYIFMLILSKDTLKDRLIQRQNEHFMNPQLLDSQIDTLEIPTDGIDEPETYIINCNGLSPNDIIEQIRTVIKQ